MVWFLDRDQKRVTTAARDSGANAYFVAVEIGDEPGVQAVFEQIFEQHSRVDIAINSAGIVGPNNRRITETPADGYEQVVGFTSMSIIR